MSIYSDYKCGAMSYDEYKSACAQENRMEKYYEDHMYDEYYEDEECEEEE